MQCDVTFKIRKERRVPKKWTTRRCLRASNAGSIAILRRCSELHRSSRCQTELDQQRGSVRVCIRLGLPLPGLTPATRCLRNCALMGPGAELDEATVSESILTGRHFLGCAACGTYCRHNGAVQTLHDFFRLEMGFSGRTRTVGSNYVGRQGTSDRYTDGQVWGSPHTGAQIAFDVGIVEPNSISHSMRSGCSQSFFNVNAGTTSRVNLKG